MTDESNEPDDQSEHGETPDQPSPDGDPADEGGTDRADESDLSSDAGGVDTEESEDTDSADDGEESSGEAETNEDATGADPDAADTEETAADLEEEGTTTPDSSQDGSNERVEGESDPPNPTDGGPANGGPADDGPELTRLGVLTAIVVPTVGVAAAIVLFALDVDPRDALFVGFAYLSLVTVGTGLYVFTNRSEQKVKLLRATGGFAAALLGVSGVVVLTADTGLIEFAPIVSQPVPLFVYVYAVAGALGYVFTLVGEQRLNSSGDPGSEDTDGSNDTASDSTKANPDETDEPIKPSKIYDWSIRVLAAIPLAAAVFLLASLLLPQSQFGDPEVIVRTAGDHPVVVNETGVSRQLTENTSVQRVDIKRRRGSDRLLAGVALLTGLFVNTAYTRLHDLAVQLLSASRKEGNDDSE